MLVAWLCLWVIYLYFTFKGHVSLHLSHHLDHTFTVPCVKWFNELLNYHYEAEKKLHLFEWTQKKSSQTCLVRLSGASAEHKEWFCCGRSEKLDQPFWLTNHQSSQVHSGSYGNFKKQEVVMMSLWMWIRVFSEDKACFSARFCAHEECALRVCDASQ